MERYEYKLKNFKESSISDYEKKYRFILEQGQKDIENVKLASPITHADGSCIPFYIYHGGNDKTVSINESEKLYDKLKASGAKEIYFQRITDGPHSVRHERITQQMLNFFDRYLHDDKSVLVDDSEFSLN